MSKKWLLIPILLIFIFAISITGLSQYKYTEQSGTGYFVSEADHADALENQNELRMILDELGLLLEHSKYGDASYPADENTTPGTLDIFTDYYTKLEIDAFGFITGVAWGDITGTLSNQSDLNTALGNKLANVSEDTTPELGGELDAGAHSIGFTQITVNPTDGTTTIDWKNGNHARITLGAQNETFTFIAPSNHCSFTMVIVQDSVGGRDITWPATVRWLGTEPTWTDGGASKGIVVGFYYDGTDYWADGSEWES